MGRQFRLLTRAACLLSLLAGVATVQAAAPLVDTNAGPVAGKSAGGVDAFLGIPYAGDTGGANRWRPPQPVPAWTAVRQATDFGADCLQEPPHNPPGGSPWTAEYFPTGTASENCLFVNVWRPAGAATTGSLPVLVWIHGGAFVGGSGAVPLYDGSALAHQGIIVVSLNYRLGVFGFMAHPALSQEAGSSGNYGLMDQIAALRWVKENIARFGGDPTRVTVAGQSAGAASVHALLASPSAAGLFGQAIAQSGSGMGIPILPHAAAEAMGEKLLNAAGVESIEALRALPADAVARAGKDPSLGPPGLRFAPITEPSILPDPAKQRLGVPVLTGLTADESSTGRDWSLASVAQLDDLLVRRFGDKAIHFRPFYTASDDATASVAVKRLLREQAIASMLAWAQARPADAAPVHAYLFNHTQTGTPAERFGSFHSVELAYMFGTLDKSGRAIPAADRAIAASMMGYWVNFVRDGDPNAKGSSLPVWPRLSSGKIMGLGDKTGPLDPLEPARRDAYRDFVAGGGKLGLF